MHLKTIRYSFGDIYDDLHRLIECYHAVQEVGSILSDCIDDVTTTEALDALASVLNNRNPDTICKWHVSDLQERFYFHECLIVPDDLEDLKRFYDLYKEVI